MAKESPPGSWLDVGGHRLHVRELGRGPVTVLLEAGAGGSGDHWGEVPALLADDARVLVYDRAGLGRSDRARQRRTADALVGDTLALLDALGVREPAVLVGHSFGAALIRLLAARHPRRVAALVFVDGWHEAMAEWERSKGLNARSPRWLHTALNLLSRLRIFRVVEALREAEAHEAVDRENGAVARLPVPIRAIVSGAMLTAAEAPRGYPVSEHNAAWRAASSKLAALSAESGLTVLETCDHHIPLREPQAVVDAVRAVMAARAVATQV